MYPQRFEPNIHLSGSSPFCVWSFLIIHNAHRTPKNASTILYYFRLVAASSPFPPRPGFTVVETVFARIPIPPTQMATITIDKIYIHTCTYQTNLTRTLPIVWLGPMGLPDFATIFVLPHQVTPIMVSVTQHS